GGIQAHGLAELVAGERGLTDLEEGVGQVLAQVGAGWGGLDGGEEGGHGYIVIAAAQGGVGAVRCYESRVARLGRGQQGRDGEEDGDAHITLEIVVVRWRWRGSQANWGAVPARARTLPGKPGLLRVERGGKIKRSYWVMVGERRYLMRMTSATLILACMTAT